MNVSFFLLQYDKILRKCKKVYRYDAFSFGKLVSLGNNKYIRGKGCRGCVHNAHIHKRDDGSKARERGRLNKRAERAQRRDGRDSRWMMRKLWYISCFGNPWFTGQQPALENLPNIALDAEERCDI